MPFEVFIDPMCDILWKKSKISFWKYQMRGLEKPPRLNQGGVVA